MGLHVGVIRKTLRKFRNAFRGIRSGLLYDQSILIQIILAVCTVIIFALLGITQVEWLFVISAIFAVLITEFLNSAVEDVCDLLVKNYNLHVKEIKDIAAAAVLLAALYAILVAAIILKGYIIL